MKIETNSRQQRFQRVDRNGDGQLQPEEIRDYLEAEGELRTGADEARLMREFAASFEPTRASGYTSYEQMAIRLDQLARKYPELAQRVSLGKSVEGREIWALRIGKQPEGKAPGVVITGCHHAREWMTVEVPLELASKMLDGYSRDKDMKSRVESLETWIVPMVNPDGYEYSRTEDSWWRKNRRVNEETGCPQPKPPSGDFEWPTPVGVDLNRNYFDPNRPEMYRDPGDKPCSYQDDPSHTSDGPRTDTYRGPRGASEPETQAMQKLVLQRPNIRGVLDYHSYGNLILIPWGYKNEQPVNVAEYQRLGAAMNQALGGDYKVQPSMDLYPTTGTSSDVFHANGKLAITMEIGKSFQPPASEIPATVEKLTRANLAFLDHFK
ncbi:hypothetical protein JST97_24945 [bacterium]|nr:hypothetical protein [bacterium]